MLFLCQILIYGSIEGRSICNVKTTSFTLDLKQDDRSINIVLTNIDFILFYFLMERHTAMKVMRNSEFRFKASPFTFVLKA